MNELNWYVLLIVVFTKTCKRYLLNHVSQNDGATIVISRPYSHTRR